MGLDFEDGDEIASGDHQAPKQVGLPTQRNVTSSSSGPAPAAYRLRRAEMMLGCYPADAVGNPTVYCASIAALLGEYIQVVIDIATDPRTGIQNQTDKPPTIKQLRKFCEAEAVRQQALERARNRPKVEFNRTYTPPPNYPGCRAEFGKCPVTFVGPLSPNYPVIDAWTKAKETDNRDWKRGQWKEHTGIWVALNRYEELVVHAKVFKSWKSPTNQELLAKYPPRSAP